MTTTLDTTETRAFLLRAEHALLAQLTDPTTASSKPNYDGMEYCLKFARRIRELYTDMEKDSCDSIPKFDDALDGKTRVSKKTIYSSNLSSRFPIYFVSQEKLFKVGEKNDGSENRYKKIVPMSDVIAICRAASEAIDSEGQVIMRKLNTALRDLPSYKVQVTIMALVSVGMLKQACRGKYLLEENQKPSSSDWIDALYHTEERMDLIEKA